MHKTHSFILFAGPQIGLFLSFFTKWPFYWPQNALFLLLATK